MWTSNINQAKEKGGLENVDVWETATVGIATATGTTAAIATGGAIAAVAPASAATLGGMVTIGATSSLAGGIATRASYNCAYNLNSPMSNQLDYVLDPKAQAYDMVVGGLSGGVAYGISNYSPKKPVTGFNNFNNKPAISKNDALRIQNAANRTNQRITVVGSRANGTANEMSDWDYVMSGNSAQRHSAASSVPRGVAGGEYDFGIDIFTDNPRSPFYTPIDKSKPHVTFNPQNRK